MCKISYKMYAHTYVHMYLQWNRVCSVNMFLSVHNNMHTLSKIHVHVCIMDGNTVILCINTECT